MRKRDLILAAAVLTVLTGLLTVSYAQDEPQVETAPDPFELRRQILERVEDAVTRNDTDELGSFVQLGELRDALKEQEATDTVPTRVEQPLLDVVTQILVCDRNYERRMLRCAGNEAACARDAYRADRDRRRAHSGGRPRNRRPTELETLREEKLQWQLEKALNRCAKVYNRCAHSAAQKRTTCYLLASLIELSNEKRS